MAPWKNGFLNGFLPGILQDMSGRFMDRRIAPVIWLVGSLLLIYVFASEAAEMTQRQLVLQAMQQRPHDPWPRGTGHVIMALPGSRELQKAYHEPGGSFSPSVGSFGVSLWMTGPSDAITTTSDRLPLPQCHQQWVWPTTIGLPSLLTDTPFYQSIWSSVGPGRWQLQLQIKTNTNTPTNIVTLTTNKTLISTNKTMVSTNTLANANSRIQLVIRSVGPAGGPIYHLDWNGQRLLINNRWALSCDPLPAAVHLGHEGAAQWRTLNGTNRQVRNVDGWGFARLEFSDARTRRILIHDSVAIPPSGLAMGSTRTVVDISVPDEQFVPCLNAQITQLMMGLVGRETRSADPAYSPLSWLRDAAYIIVALAQAGQIEAARQLSTLLAETDFFGGNGPEADCPGLALWTLNEVASRLGQPRLEQLLWPHVSRKANLIVQMRTTPWPLFKPVVGVVLPQNANRPDLTLVCDPARNGLIMGKVDWERPVAYVNAVSYRGLLSAAEMAVRLGDLTSATLWRTHATELKQALNDSMAAAPGQEDYLFSCGLWPTWAVNDLNAYSQVLSTRWNQKHDQNGQITGILSKTFLEVAETHQWLCLGRPEQVWYNLQWFWDNQASPGLYTWWESAGKESPFPLWERTRGWVTPPHVTPQYRTAAEMLLLQMAILARVDETGAMPVLIIGAGIPYEWLAKSMHVRGLYTRVGRVDWNWDGGKMQVIVRGQRCPVRLGPSFAANTPMAVRY